MSNFKRGDKVECIEGSTSTGVPVSTIKGSIYTVDHCIDRFMSLVEVPDFSFPHSRFKLVDTRHIHHDMIVVWAANPSRIVEAKMKTANSTQWKVATDWNLSELFEYRFADTVIPERVFPVTGISGSELEKIFINTSSKNRVDLKAVANAAIKQYILDTEA